MIIWFVVGLFFWFLEVQLVSISALSIWLRPPTSTVEATGLVFPVGFGFLLLLHCSMLRRLLGGFEEADRPTSFVDLGIGACLF